MWGRTPNVAYVYWGGAENPEGGVCACALTPFDAQQILGVP